jgi:hypothetical protein
MLMLGSVEFKKVEGIGQQYPPRTNISHFFLFPAQQ